MVEIFINLKGEINLKRILALFLAFTMIFSFAAPILAESNYDQAGEILKNLGLLQGNEEGDLKLDSNLYRKHMIVMISRLYGEEDQAKKFVGINKFPDLKPIHKADIPYITWAVDKGLIQGKANGMFGIDDYVTVQEYQAVLLRALGYGRDTENWNMVPEVANSFGLMEGVDANPVDKMNRGAMSVMTINALRQEKNGESITLAEFLNVDLPDLLEVESSYKIESNTIEIKGQAKGFDNLLIEIKPISSTIEMAEKYAPISTDEQGNFTYKESNLEVGEYQYRFRSGKKATTYNTFKISSLPFEFLGARADNLKEIHLNFTQALDRNLMSFKDNYSTTAGPIKDIRFEDNDKKIVLTLEGTMTQRNEYTVSVMKIRSKSGEESKLDKHAFQALDTNPPEVSSIVQLGNKGIRIYFSEPIKRTNINDFKVNGKRFSGNIKHDNNIVTLSYYSKDYALPEGNHEIEISSVEDYAGYKTISRTYPFSIKRDTEAPKILDARASLDTVYIKFDEDIDPISETYKDVYLRVGNTKIYAISLEVRGKELTARFKNTLSTASNTVYIGNVVDYSGNKVNSEVQVTPVIDTSRPEVINYSVSNDGRTITVYYSKEVAGRNRQNYSILDKDGKIVNIRDIQGSGREYRINLYNTLPIGLNKFTIQGVEDTTALKNQVIPFSAEIDMKDIERPKLLNYTGYANNIVLHFSKLMDMASVTDPSNYIMTFKGQAVNLPSNSLFTPSEDGKSVNILLPENYNGNKVMIGLKDSLTELDIFRLKDISGNDIDPLLIKIKFDGTSTGDAKPADYYSTRPGKQGVLTESNLIKIRFNLPIIQASEDDFRVNGRDVLSVDVDGTDLVTLYLNNQDSTAISDGRVSIVSNNNMKTSIGTGVEASIVYLLDELAPRIKADTSELNVSGNQIEIPFTEKLDSEGASLYRRDLEIVRLEDNTVLDRDSYSTSLKGTDPSVILVSINNRKISSKYSVRLTGEHNPESLSYIRDVAGNLALTSDVYFTSREINKQ